MCLQGRFGAVGITEWAAVRWSGCLLRVGVVANVGNFVYRVQRAASDDDEAAASG